MAKELDVGFSATLEQDLIELSTTIETELWHAQNKNVIAAYNKSVEDDGVFSDGLRSF